VLKDLCRIRSYKISSANLLYQSIADSLQLVRRKIAHKPRFQTDQEVLREIMSGYHTSEIQVSEYFQSRTYEGPAGPISLDLNGDPKFG